MSLQLLVVGATSSLFSSLNARLNSSLIMSNYQVRSVALLRNKLRNTYFLQNVEILSYDGSDQDFIASFDRFVVANPAENRLVLWMSTHDSVTCLAHCALHYPTLFVGSGAQIDFYRGIIDLNKVDEGTRSYIHTKIRMSMTPGVTTLCPGFYIEDVPGAQPTGAGLHNVTSKFLYAENFDPTQKWGAAKYITFKSMLVDVIVQWCTNATIRDGMMNRWFHVGTSESYQRWQLRALALGNDSVPLSVQEQFPAVPGRPYEQYANELQYLFDNFDLGVDEFIISQDFEVAKNFVY